MSQTDYIATLVQRFTKAISDFDVSLLIEICSINPHLALKLDRETKTAPIHVAAMSGSLELAKVVLERSSSSVEIIDGKGRTPLHLAAEFNQIEIAQLLLDHDASLDCLNNDKYTPLMVAASLGNVYMVRLLVDMNTENSTTLGLAASCNHVDVCQLFLSHGITISTVPSETGTALHLAVKSGAINVAKLLLECVNNVADIPDIEGWLPIHFTAKTGDIKMLKLFVDYGCSLLSCTPKSWTLLHIAADYGQLEISQYLIDAGCDLNATDSDGYAPIHIAAMSDNHTDELSQLLIDHQCKLNYQNSILHDAIRYNKFKLVCKLLEVGVDENNVSSDGYTTWHVAAERGNLQILELLAKSNFTAFNALTKDGENALICFTGNGENSSKKALKLILSKTDDINTICCDVTALILTIIHENYEFFRILLEAGANVNCGYGFGCTTLVNAIMSNQIQMAKDLLQFGADVNSLSMYQRKKPTAVSAPPVYFAARFESVEILKILLDQNASLNTLEFGGPAHVAARHNRVKVLKKIGMSMNELIPNTLVTPFREAVYNHAIDSMKYLLENGVYVDLGISVDNLVSQLCNKTIDPCKYIDTLLIDYCSSNTTNLIVNQKLARIYSLKNFVQHLGHRYKFSHQTLSDLLNHCFLWIPVGVDAISQIVQLGADVNAISYLGVTPICVAVIIGDLEAVKILAANGANVDFMAEDGATVLTMAVKANKYTITKVLLDYGADPNKYSNNTPILHQTNQWSIIYLLFEYGVCANQANKDGQTTLHLWVDSATVNSNEICGILDLGANVNARDKHGNYPLTLAASNKSEIQVLKMLVERGAEINVKNQQKKTALQLALAQNDIQKAEFLLHCGANIEIQDHKGYTALHYVIRVGNVEFLSKLLNHGSNFDAVSKSGENVFNLAFKYNQLDILKLLMDRRSESNTATLEFPLHQAAKTRATLSFVKYFVSTGIDFNAKDADGWTPLMLAAKSQNIKLIFYLCKIGADTEILSKDKFTVLQYTVSRGFANQTECLLAYANANVVTAEEKTLLHIAASMKSPETLSTLLLNDYQKLDVNAKDKDGFTVLHIAARKNFAAVKCILESKCGAEINAVDVNGKTPLHVALGFREIDIAKLLIDYGADPTIVASNGSSANDVAVNIGCSNKFLYGK
ncbi:hypothetical protein HK100_001866 [Physocladia obscura]|uniref:Uncharacterized protein n=1 Tax=Physocladia obscura TaxID=109957 RepID=A0AAD5SW71_9FUNG|nr:hypothetical protein HK100_001866 [Physocladia obscura]